MLPPAGPTDRLAVPADAEIRATRGRYLNVKGTAIVVLLCIKRIDSSLHLYPACMPQNNLYDAKTYGAEFLGR